MATTINPSDQTITQYNVQTGGASNLLNNVAPSATSGVPVISQGASAQPIFGTAVVAGGGTGNTTFTAYSVIAAGTTATGAFQNVSGVGTTGQVLTSNGASALPTWQANGSPPNATVSIVDDFICTNVPAVGFFNSQLGWVTGANAVAIVPLGQSAHPGVIGLSTVTTGTQQYIISSANSSRMVPGGGVITCNWVFNIATLSNATNRYNLFFGLGDTVAAGAQANGIYFRYSDNANSGQWQIVTTAASSPTTTSSSTAATAAWHNASIVINAAGNSIEFFMDGVSLGTITTTIPTLSVGPMFKIDGIAGAVTSLTVSMDLFYMTQTLTTPR